MVIGQDDLHRAAADRLRQVAELQSLPVHERPAQLSEVQVADRQVSEAHDVPVKAVPLQTLPFQVPPVQACPFFATADHVPGTHRAPKMSFSPVSAAPVVASTTCEVPRAPSSVPRPVAAVKVCVAFIGMEIVAASPMSSWPAPAAIGSAPASGSAVRTRSFLT